MIAAGPDHQPSHHDRPHASDGVGAHLVLCDRLSMRLHIMPLDRAADLERDLSDRREMAGTYDLVRKPGPDERWDVVKATERGGEFIAVEGNDRHQGDVIVLKGGKVGMVLVKPVATRSPETER